MSKRLVVVSGVVAAAVLAIGSVALAQHGSPPTYVDAGGFTLSMGVETTNGQVYHDNNTAGRSGQTCSSATADDGAGDNSTECWNSREQLKTKNVGPNEGGAVACPLVPAQNVGPNQVVFDGVWLDDCDAPDDQRGRAYTGVAVAGAGNGGLAAGGDVPSQSGCVQAFGEDDTPGNLIKTTTDTLQSAGGTPHGGSDDDTDVTICGDGA
jgi:hypothetical protein